MQLFAPNVEKLAEKRDLKGLAKAVGYEKSRKVQVAAVNALAELGDVDGVIAALDAGEPSVRTAAIEALGDIGESRAIPPLVRVALTDPSDSSYEPQFQYTRRAAARALSQHGEAGVAPLLEALGDPHHVGAAAVALGEIKYRPSLAALTDLEAGLARVIGTEGQGVEGLGDLMFGQSEHSQDELARIGAGVAQLERKLALERIHRAVAWALAEIGESAPPEPAQPETPAPAAARQAPSRLGVLFDIEGLDSGLYGYAAYKIFFGAVDTSLLAGSILFDGDTSETLAGAANQYCIAIFSPLDPSNLVEVRKALATLEAPGLLPAASRFIADERVQQEPLVQSARIDSAGNLVDCKIGWVMEAWQESRR